MEYNTERSHLVMREYGRHIQKMVEYLVAIEDPEKRQQQARVVIELMGVLNPHLRNVEDFKHKLWDHLFYISDFKLDIDSPYPKPEKATYRSKPDPLPYPKRHPKYSHLGKNLELVLDKALHEDNEEKKNGLANAIAYYMKLAYNNWHHENIHDDGVRNELRSISGGKLDLNPSNFMRQRLPSFDHDEHRGSAQNRKGNFSGRSRSNGNGSQRDKRKGGSQQGGNQRSGGHSFKKRFK